MNNNGITSESEICQKLIPKLDDRQRSGKNQAVTFGEMMLRLKSPGFERLFQSSILEATFGGAEGNVAVSLANYGIDVNFVTAMPNNSVGDAAIRFLKSMEVNTDYIIRDGERLGIYYLETGSGPRPSNVIYDRAYSSISTVSSSKYNWDLIFSKACWFHTSGITPAISENAANSTIKAVQTANNMGLTVSVDLNYRKKLWKWGKKSIEIMPQIVELTDIIIANEEDIQKSLGIKIESDEKLNGVLDREKYFKLGKKVLEQYPNLKMVAITLRESFSATHNGWGAILIVRGLENPLISKRYELKNIIDRVGGGDSFSAGLIYALMARLSLKDSLEFAVAASALKHTIPGDVNRVSVNEVKRLMEGDASGRVRR